MRRAGRPDRKITAQSQRAPARMAGPAARGTRPVDGWPRVGRKTCRKSARPFIVWGVKRAAEAVGQLLWLSIAAISLLSGCTTVDPGPNFVVADERFDEDFFYCHVEPEFLFAKRCGPGDPGQGDPSSGCHFNGSSVSGMVLRDHAPVDCGGGDKPLSRAQIGPGSAAQGNLQASSLVMSRDYLTAPIVVRPSGANHPRAVIARDDPAVDVIRRWAERP